MRDHRTRSGLRLLAVLALGMALGGQAAFAYQAEGGTKNCGSTLTGKVHARYKDIAALTGPGGTTGYYTPDDGAWHVQERWGEDGGGDWDALGDPYLDLVNTYAFCVNA